MSVGEPYVKNQFAFLNPMADAGGFADHNASAAKSVGLLPLPAAVGVHGSGQAGSDVPIAHGGFVQAVSMSFPGVALAGSYATFVVSVIQIVLGATAPSALALSGTVAGGGALELDIPASALVNNAMLIIPFSMVGVGAYAAGSGDAPEVSVKATGQDVTVKASSYLQGVMVPAT